VYMVAKRERGVVTLLTAVVLMLAVFGISYFTSEVVIHEKQLVANDYRAAQALNSAIAGMDQAVAYLDNNNSPLLAASSAFTSSGRFSYTMTGSSSNAIVSIVSEGWSEDEAVKRVITQTFGQMPANPLINNAPTVPVIALGSADLTGNIKIYNNYNKLTVWTGQPVANWGSGNTYINIDGNPNQLSSTKNGRGPDVVENDLNLATLGEDGLVANYFAEPFSTWQSLEDQYNPGGANAGGTPSPTDCTDGGVIHYSGALDLPGGTYGVNKQCILIVDGPLTLNGNVTFNGMILARSVPDGNANVTVNGALIATGHMGGDPGDPSKKLNGNVSIVYTPIDADIPNPLDGFVGFGFVTSSWKDW